MSDSDIPESMRGTRDSTSRTDRENVNRSATNETTTASQPRGSPSLDKQESGSTSFASRIQSSATGLARSVLQGAGSSADAAKTLASATQGKAAGPSAAGVDGSQRWASRDVIAQRGSGAGTGAGAGSTADGTGVAESFRNEATRMGHDRRGGFELPLMSEESFQQTGALAGNDTVQSHADWRAVHSSDTSRGHLQDELLGGKGKQRMDSPSQLDLAHAWKHAQPESNSPQVRGHEPRPDDGAAVVSLLADPSFDPDFGGPEDLDLDIDAAPPPLTESEIKMLESFRKQIGDSTNMHTSPQQPGLSSLSLVPDIDTFLQQNDPSAFTGQGVHSDAKSSLTLRDSVLEYLPGAADWVTVHERYHDEVWGYLRPALEAAKAEVEERNQSDSEEGAIDGPAVRRLKMILGHMQR
ncbi:hypothetical protein POX_h09776 [Penicillium oxalicum]|uniref:hypothetical protein n=1 Tax=Penicillium oxalicum TaxID=69781 RepID=UPI0020B89364|nr:hypothetical protein POX_h09776 [Penicillium oxalicum]KAI2786011.1 hypothetical protein POX_h09776 [Penicillium oxalicum]